MAHRDPNDLTIEEQKFFKAYLELGNLGEAYQKAFPRSKATVTSSRQLGSRMMRAIRGKADFQKRLDEAGLGEERLMAELEKRLNATKVKPLLVDAVSFTPKGRKRIKKEVLEVGPYEDNSIRMRGTELLARVLEKDVQKIRGEHVTANLEISLTKAEEAAARKRFYKMFPGLKPPSRPRKPRKNAKK